jgi:excisionase family DNA binding protein
MNYTVKEVARILRVCDRTVRNFIARGDLPAVRVGRKLLVSPRSVEAFCRMRTVTPTNTGESHSIYSGDSHVKL